MCLRRFNVGQRKLLGGEVEVANEALGAEAETKQQGYTRAVFLCERWSEVDVVEIDDQCRRQGEIVDSLVLQ
jgi:hypothetical protein